MKKGMTVARAHAVFSIRLMVGVLAVTCGGVYAVLAGSAGGLFQRYTLAKRPLPVPQAARLPCSSVPQASRLVGVCGPDTQWGYWGSLERLDQHLATAPKYSALQQFIENNR